MTLPAATPNPCDDCPWRRNSIKGWLGPQTADEWLALAHADGPIACHQTIKHADENGEADWDDPGLRQCRGAAIFRANICKSPRDPEVARGPADRDRVFSWDNEFKGHHSSPLSQWLEDRRD